MRTLGRPLIPELHNLLAVDAENEKMPPIEILTTKRFSNLHFG
jgi:hypothetical protein